MESVRELFIDEVTLAELDAGTADSETRVLSRMQLARIISRCLNGEISEQFLIDWASKIELTDCVMYEIGYEQLIADVLNSLASPEINGNLSMHKIEELRRLLK